MITLKNKDLEATINPQGAELQSLLHSNGIQYLWNGDATYWPKYSPLLFPIVGSLKDGTYNYNGQSYQLAHHGFCREKVFTVNQVSASEAVFTLTHDDATLKVYPFQFKLQLHYTLTDSQLQCTYRVNNTGSSKLLFSVGGHPAFNVPLVPGTEYTDHYLQFNKSEPLVQHKLENKLTNGVTEKLDTENGLLPLKSSLFYDDAVVLKNLESTEVKLGSDKHGHGVQFDFSGFPYLGIWAAKDAPFVCIEPWCGIADSSHHNQDFEKKEGINSLAPGADWERSWKVTCF